MAICLWTGSRIKYIFDLCEENPELDEYYGIKSNKGYGAQKHRDGIMKYGISETNFFIPTSVY